MMRAVSTLLLLVCALVIPSAGMAQRDEGAEVKEAVHAFARAFASANVEALDSLLTKDYLHVNGRSGNVLQRGEWLQWVKSRRQALDSGELEITVYEMEDLIIHVYGRAAVVTAEVHAAGMERGVKFRSRVRFTNLWIFTGGRWQRAAFHDTPLTDQE